jgi:hypothetical protein
MKKIVDWPDSGLLYGAEVHLIAERDQIRLVSSDRYIGYMPREALGWCHTCNTTDTHVTGRVVAKNKIELYSNYIKK